MQALYSCLIYRGKTIPAVLMLLQYNINRDAYATENR